MVTSWDWRPEICSASPRAATPVAIARLAARGTRVPVSSATDISTALAAARADAGPDGIVCVTGSLALAGDARTQRPAIVVGFRSFATGCRDPELCAAEVADSDLSQGQGIHGSFGRHDTHNFMAAIGPDFRTGFVDPAPVSNADLAPTLAHILGVELDGAGQTGRVIAEALREGPAPRSAKILTQRSRPAANGFVTVLQGQTYDARRYYDAAGMPGRTIGLAPPRP